MLHTSTLDGTAESAKYAEKKIYKKGMIVVFILLEPLRTLRLCGEK